MKICKVCKTENEEQFIYCKNCGAQLEVAPPPAPVIPVAQEAPAVPHVPPTPMGAPNPYAGVQYNSYVPAPPAPPVPPVAPMPPAGLVAVEMILPDPANPEYRCPQKVYVTPAQKAAIQYDAIKHGRRI